MNSAVPPSFRPLSVAAGIRAAMHRAPDKIAITCGDRHRDYRTLVRRIDAVSQWLTHGAGLQRGQHGAILAGNCLEYLEIVCGAAQAGVPLATINPRLSASDVVDICNDAEARVLIVDAAHAEFVSDAAFETIEEIVVIGDQLDSQLARASGVLKSEPVMEWETFTIPYTSGTTGRPKGVMVSHRSRILTMLGMGVEYGCYSPDDRFLAFAPLCHGAGLVFGLAPVFFGGHVEILARFDPEEVLRRLRDGRMTGVFMVPTHFHALFSLDDDVRRRYSAPDLRTIISNAAALPQPTKERIVEYFGDGLLHETYGSTEAGIVTNLRPADQLRKQRCVGQPFVATEIRILGKDGAECAPGEVGELYSTSPYLFNGYWRQPDATDEAFRDGWVSVGDLARRDDEGYIYIVDRKKDMIISGGINIYPREIEEVLAAHPGIAEAAVVGVPDERWGERLQAYVVVEPGESLDAESLARFCDGKLAAFKIPKAIEAIAELPRNPSGKILKRALRERARPPAEQAG